MTITATVEAIYSRFITASHADSDYFSAIKRLVNERNRDPENHAAWQQAIDKVYALVAKEILTNSSNPVSPVKFGTSGWRGLLGKDLFIHSVASVTAAILTLYDQAETNSAIRTALGVTSFSEMQQRGCIVGFDNRFGGATLALAAVNVLAANGVQIFYAGEATTGILSAAVLERNAAFSINLTPSHNPLQYGGFKYNAADGGPAAPILTETITNVAREILSNKTSKYLPETIDLQKSIQELAGVEQEEALCRWQDLVRRNKNIHGLDYDTLLEALAQNNNIIVGVDAVHGASRDYIKPLLADPPKERLLMLRDTVDPTFGGIAPEPSSINMQPVMTALRQRQEPLKIGAIIDPDGDRIRFTDGTVEISMNQFGAMAYHFLHEIKGKKGMVAKTVATSNLANAIASRLDEEVFEPKVGFKEFKPVIGKALVYFEESDGISIIGHTPEKDAFIGLILAIDMVLSLGKNLGEYLQEIEETYGSFYPDRDGITVSQQGEKLRTTLAQLEKYGPKTIVPVGHGEKTIKEVLTIDGRKMIFEDDSWIMIRPSGTEPKVRFYVEARNPAETSLLVERAKSMLAEIGLLT